jgi:Zn-dependent protease with chaperone function
MTGGLRSIYKAVLWASCAYYYLSIPLVLATVVLAGGGFVYMFVMLGWIPIKLVLIAGILVLVTVWAGIKSLFVRGVDEDPGERLDLAEHPRLRSLLDEVAHEIRTRPVDNVYLTPGTQLAVMERGGMLRQLRGNSERCLILGVGVLDGLKVGPFKAILAHEYGHFSNEDTAGGGFALAVRRSLATMGQALAENGAATWYNPAWLFLHGFYRVFLRISQGASRLQELLADRWAAFTYGARAFEQGLRHVIERSIRFDRHAGATLAEVVGTATPVANFYTYVPEKQPEEIEIVNQVQEAVAAMPSPYDSHPSPRDRFAWVHSLEHEGGTGSMEHAGEDAWSLFGDREAIERNMTEAIRVNVMRSTGTSFLGPEKGRA